MTLFRFDIWTLLVVFSILTLVLGIGFILFGQKYQATFSGIKTVGSSMVLTSVGITLNSMQVLLSPLICIITANIIILFGVHFLFLGAVKFIKSNTSVLLNSLITAIAVFLSILFFITDSIEGRIVVISTYTVICFSRMAYLFISNSKSYNKKLYIFLSILFLLMALIHVYRIIDIYTNRVDSLMEKNPGQSLVIIMLIISTIVMSISFFNLVTNELNFVKDVFTSTLAHEMRTPFNSIIGFAQLLSEKELTDEERSNYMDYINLSAHNGMQNLDNLLEWSKTRIAKMNLDIQELNIVDLFNELLAINQPIIKHKKIVVEKKFKDSIMYGDKEFIHLIISNLLSNAVKFSPNKGKIELECENKDSFFSFSVTNDGKTLSKNDVKKLNMNNLLKSKPGTLSEKGSGLGLFIVKSFIENQKGKLHIESNEINGNTFTVQIPNHTK